PMKIRAWTHAPNSAARRMYCAAAPASTTTRYSAACTTFCERTTPIAATAMPTARIQNATFCAITLRSLSPVAAPFSLLLGLRADLEGLGLGDRVHPLAELALVVEEARDV